MPEGEDKNKITKHIFIINKKKVSEKHAKEETKRYILTVVFKSLKLMTVYITTTFIK